MMSKHSVENELTRNSSGNTWPQLPQLSKPLWTEPVFKSTQADLHLKNKQEQQRQNKTSAGGESRMRGKSHHNHVET